MSPRYPDHLKAYMVALVTEEGCSQLEAREIMTQLGYFVSAGSMSRWVADAAAVEPAQQVPSVGAHGAALMQQVATLEHQCRSYHDELAEKSEANKRLTREIEHLRADNKRLTALRMTLFGTLRELAGGAA